MHMCLCVCRGKCVPESVKTRGFLGYILQELSTLSFDMGSFNGPELAAWTGLALCLAFKWVLGVKLRSLSVHGQHFAD